MINLETFYEALDADLDAEERQAIGAPSGAALCLEAGTGTDKTPCLTVPFLKFLMIDAVPFGSIETERLVGMRSDQFDDFLAEIRTALIDENQDTSRFWTTTWRWAAAAVTPVGFAATTRRFAGVPDPSRSRQVVAYV